LAGIFLLASVFWFFAVLIEGLLVAFGLSEDIAAWLSPAAFCVGLILGAFAMSIEVYEKFGRFIGRNRKNHVGH
jgi:hypothetical protein